MSKVSDTTGLQRNTACVSWCCSGGRPRLQLAQGLGILGHVRVVARLVIRVGERRQVRRWRRAWRVPNQSPQQKQLGTECVLVTNPIALARRRWA